jgi:hypothetical protein
MSFLVRSSLDERKPIWFLKILLDDRQYIHIIFIFFLDIKPILLYGSEIWVLVRILKRKKKKLFCAFFDFEKAFDTVWRDALWYKLL